jgi:hypothetical protein
VLAAVLTAAIPLAVVATAFACGSLATLKLNRATAAAGDPVTARGGNFNSSRNASAVQIRFNGRNGRILWEGRPTANGRLTATFDAPAARPGYYVIVATQTGPDGRPAAGTPGRAPLRIRGAASSRASSAAPAAPWAAPPGGGGPTAPPFALAAGGVLALVLFTGVLALAHSARRRRRAPGLAQSLS